MSVCLLGHDFDFCDLRFIGLDVNGRFGWEGNVVFEFFFGVCMKLYLRVGKFMGFFEGGSIGVLKVDGGVGKIVGALFLNVYE